MEIQLTAENEAQLTELARRQGREPAVVAGELVALGLEQEERTAAKKQEVRALLGERWQRYQSGNSFPLDGEDVRREMKARTQAHRERRR